MTHDVFDDPRLVPYGWDAGFSEAARDMGGDAFVPGRVIRGYRTRYVILTGEGEREAVVRGRLMFEAADMSAFPVTGDWVLVGPNADGPAMIQAILPRRTKFSRRAAGRETEEQVLAANVDTAFWVSSLNRVFNPRRIERFIAAVREGGAEPVVVLNKADLADDAGIRALEVRMLAPEVPVIVASGLDGRGVDEIAARIGPGRTVVFLGQSGVGKSTIVNRLFGADIQSVQDIRAFDDKGRHTTVRRELIPLPGGGMVIDTPGIRELQLWDEQATPDGFDDIAELGRDCRFADCTHGHEPGCAVKRAADEGRLDPARLVNYRRMLDELDHLERQRDIRGRIEEKRRVKRFGRLRSQVAKMSDKR